MFFIEPISIICAVIGLLLGMIVGIFYRKRIAEAKVGVAEDRANKIVDEAVKDAEARKKEILLEAKEDSIRTKNDWKKKFVTKKRTAEK